MGVISAFPATGKTWLSRACACIDSDSSRYSWSRPGQRHPDWPDNYMAHIQALAWAGETILVSTHVEVRQALHAAGIPFTLVYPDEGQRDEYLARMRQRGSDEAMVDLVATRWGDFIASCRAQDGCEHIVLQPGQHLADVVPCP